MYGAHREDLTRVLMGLEQSDYSTPYCLKEMSRAHIDITPELKSGVQKSCQAKLGNICPCRRAARHL